MSRELLLPGLDNDNFLHVLSVLVPRLFENCILVTTQAATEDPVPLFQADHHVQLCDCTVR